MCSAVRMVAVSQAVCKSSYAVWGSMPSLGTSELRSLLYQLSSLLSISELSKPYKSVINKVKGLTVSDVATLQISTGNVDASIPTAFPSTY